ncbi:MAG: sulfite exporter TauE/SafE family protein [Crocinitomicaceae bacterium]|nr:sulfite exporter TauE/SafE family protein [Crocinitomicaceae bacterium]
MINVFVTAFFLGLASNLHCIGMCGPLTLVLPVNRKSKLTIFWGVLIYNFGRIFTYTVLGVLVGSIGLSLNLFISVQLISIILGTLMLIIAWSSFFKELGFLDKISNQIGLFISRRFSSINQMQTGLKPLFFGLLNGLLPCGMVYLGLLNSVAAGSLVGSVISMIVFGLGTLPVMLVFAYFMQSMNRKFKSNLNKLLPYFITIAALLTIARGMNLGIPYISPKIQTEHEGLHSKPKMECCKVQKKK